MITIGPGVGFLLLVVGFVVTVFFVFFCVVVFDISVVVLFVVDEVASKSNGCEKMKGHSDRSSRAWLQLS